MDRPPERLDPATQLGLTPDEHHDHVERGPGDRLDDDSVLLNTSGFQSFTIKRDEALILYKAIAQRWPLDALSQV